MGNVAVYKKGTTNFFSQGLGLLSDVVSSTLTQTVSSTGNVEQKLEVEYPIDGYLVSELVEGAILRVSVSTDKSDYGVFEIVDTLKDDSGTITVYGDPYYNRILRMSFDNGGVFTKFSNVQSALNVAKQNITGFPADFNLTSNLSTSVDLSENTYDTFGTFLEALNSAVHGNIKYSLNSIQIYSAIGKDITDITLRDDMNTSSVKITTDFSGIINKVIPVLPVLDKDGNATDQTKVGTIVTSKYSNQFLDYWAGKVIQFDTQDLANTYFDRTNADRPVHTVDVNPIGLDDDFSTINIFDTIELYSTRLDYTDKLRVSERVFDTLSEDVTSFKLGSSSVNIFNQINEQNNEIFNNVVKLTNAAISANGKGIDYFGQAKPSSPKEGDTWFWDDGTDFGIKQYTNGEWVDLAGSNTAEKIATAVDDAVTQANAYSDQLVADNASQVNAVLDDVQAKQADLTAQQAELDTKAQGYANKALADAKANTLATATQTAKDAQEYTDTAKAEAISVATTADGVINQKIDDTASSITRTISQNKSDADGKISTAQSTATQALDGLTQKVSQNIYDAKVNELTGKVSTAQQTADGAVTTIGNYKTSNDERVASAESAIQQNANAITQKVSQTDYNAKTGELSGQISQVSQTAGQISQSVSDVKAQVDGLSVGGRNLLIGTKGYTFTNPGQWINSGVVISDTYQGLTISQTSGAWGGPKYLISDLIRRGVVNATDAFIMSTWIRNTSSTPIIIGFYTSSNSAVTISPNYDVVATLPANSDWIRVVSPLIRFSSLDVTTGSLRFEPKTDTTGGCIQQAGLKLEKGTIATDWSPAPEDVDNKISTVSQTVDSISSIVSDPTTGLTKRVQTAEGTLSQVTGADIPALQKATYWQPYSSLDLDTYTKQGSFFFNSAEIKLHGPTTMTNWMYLVVEQGTSDSERVVQTAWYDTPTDAKITYRRQYAGTWSPWYANDNDSVTSIRQTNGAIKQEVKDRTDGDSNTLTQATDFTTSSITSSEMGMKSLITQTSDAILGKVGAVNLFPNSEFEKDYGYAVLNGNTTLSLGVKNDVDGHLNGTVVVTSTAQDWQGYRARNIPVNGGQSYSMSTLVHYTNGGLSNGHASLDVWFLDKDGNRISTGTIGTGGSNNSVTGQVSSPYWVKLYIENVIAPINAVNMQVSLLVNDAGAGQYAMFTQPMVTATEKLQPYTPNNDITTQLALLKDNWSIGITDNIGKITSGIVGNYDSMSLISKNIVLDGNTTVTGTFKVSQANIANGAIGTAQIGDASITSAKISSLDINKITGNVSSFIQSNWNGSYRSTYIDNNGMSINSGNAITTFDGSGAHVKQGTKTADYAFGTWLDDSGHNTTSNGLYIGSRGDENSFTNVVGAGGGSMMLFAGANMDSGSNQNIHNGTINMFATANIRARLEFKANKVVQSTYIEADEIRRTLNFYTDYAANGDGNYFWFNQNVLSAGTFNSTSVLSKKNIKSAYDEDALGEISKTQLVKFEYKNRVGQSHVSPIIDDVNSEKQYYIPKTILGQDNEYVDMYSMISMAWKAIQQLNEKIGDK